MTLDLFPKEEQHNNTNGPVTVLGKTFANDEERRAYFREELRKKLPELKEIEGFPIGEDDDIINLSDPPFYTACPNPWINDFIAEWEEEKKELEKMGRRTPDFEVSEPYAADVSEGKNNPIYNAHSYHTKVPHPAIMRYIMHYTQPGDVIFDGFAGTGMTGVAASMCANPDADIKTKIEAENPNAVWGKRNAICGDLSPIASFISANYNNSVNILNDLNQLEKDLEDVKSKYQNNYTLNIDEKSYEINFKVWSEVFICNNCNSEVVFWDEAIENNEVKKDFTCSSCNSILNKRNLNLAKETVFDEILNETITITKKKLSFINYIVGNKQLVIENPNYISKYEDEYSWCPKIKLEGGKELRRNEKKDINFVHQLHYDESLYILSKVFEKIQFNKIGKFIFTSCLTNLLRTARYKFGRSGNVPLSGTLYVGSLQTETNPFRTFKNKIKSIRSIIHLIGTTSNVVQVSSANDILILDNSIDYIFTDPPFGANIMYSDLNYVWESWLKVFTNPTFEAVENGLDKDKLFYQTMMNKSFHEYFRILKPGKWMTVEFSNTSAAIWNTIQTSLSNSGFVIANVAALDKKQGSFKAVMTASAVKQDLVISCYKPSSEFDTKFQQSQHSTVGVWDFVEEHLAHLPIHLIKDNATTAVVERSAKILFDRLIAFYVQRSLPVPIDAGKFQEGLKERFVERDGMFFTQEQVEEYERKKAEVPEFIQMSLFVGSEQDAVYWLRQLLDKEPKTEQDLHPLWMREVVGNMRKGDILPEMRQILEENFLKDEQGKWYVPDAENEADLEKLRNKRLIKTFEDYKTIAASPKGKIKEARVEALRAGFKQCYQDKDFKTIVTVGDRIPNNLLMEDEVLLQFYDIASAKI